jgi:hypothetical protein
VAHQLRDHLPRHAPVALHSGHPAIDRDDEFTQVVDEAPV